MKYSVFLLGMPMVAHAASARYTLATSIPWSMKNATSCDQSAFYNNTYYLADRTNKGVRVVDISTAQEITVITGFVGATIINGSVVGADSGPDGLIVLENRNELYAGDGDGIIKVIDLFTNNIVARIPTNAQKRVDEMGYDPINQIIVAGIPDDDLPHVVIVSAVNRTVIGRINFPDADGIEQTSWNPVDGLFYVSVPSTPSNPGGEIAVIDIPSLSVLRVYPVPKCLNAGTAFGPNQELFIGCSEDQISTYNISQSYIMDATSGKILATIHGLAGIDQVVYDAKLNLYYAGANLDRVGGLTTGALMPIAGIVDASSYQIVQNITTDTALGKSLAVNSATGQLIVPISKMGINVYNVTNIITNATNSTSNITSPTSYSPLPSVTSGSNPCYKISSIILFIGLFVCLFN